MPNLDPGLVQHDKTFIIDRNYTVNELFGVQFPSGTTSGEVTVPDNVTFIFIEGMITCSISCNIIGANTKILAPITQIFGTNINATGLWAIDRAYPQWFGYTPESKKVEYQFDDQGNSQNDADVPDGGVAIQKAINMKVNGEVFLPHGFYVIKTPVKIPIGISLEGEMGQGAHNSTDPDVVFQGTVLQSWKTNNTQQITDASNKYMLYFNSNTSFVRLYGNGTDFKAGQISAIKNLTLFNCIPEISTSGTDAEIATRLMTQTTACIKGIYAADAVSIENVRFEYIRQALVYANTYVDSKRVVNCAVYTDYEHRFQYLSSDIYAFEMKFLGDNLLFEHNAVDGKYHKGIHLDNCFGGIISCNIINSDIAIDNSNSITVCNNHIEGGHQLAIYCSCANVRDNFFHVGSSPSISIRGNQYHDRSVVELSNNHLTFRDFGGQIDAEHYTEYENLVRNATEYDIQIDKNSIVKIRNMYRYWVRHGLASKVYTHGIKMQKILYDSQGNISSTPAFDEFNDFSYKLSREGFITVGFGIEKSFTIHAPNQVLSTNKQKNNGVIWLGASGLYLYYYQIIWDTERNIIATFNGNQLHELLTYGDPLDFIQNQEGGALLSFSTADDVNSYEFTIRLFRRRSADATNNWKTVDVPVCGARILYDNGISVCGYRWKDLNENILQTIPFYSDNDMDRITYQGDNIMCRKQTKNSIVANRVAFKPGDVLVNTGAATNWTIVTIK